jgi:iron(III) transport system substrate-binding protein
MVQPSYRALLFLALAAGLWGCGGADADVVLYCAVDQSHSEPIVRAFEAATGLVVNFQPDIEATKSIGHRRRIQEESANPRCDVFWNNEVVQSVMLAAASPPLLEAYVSPAAADIPEQFKDPDGLWTGFGARLRVLIVNTDVYPDAADYPRSTDAFLVPGQGERSGMARPLTGTTAAHGAVWLTTWGAERTFDHLSAMRDNGVRFGPGNAHLMRLVRDGKLDFGWTDTDDVKAAIDQGFPVVQVVPDQGAGEFGLIVIPNTVCLVKGAPHPEAARRLIDYLLSHEVERMLAEGPSGQIPVRAAVARPEGMLNLDELKLAPVDWGQVGAAYVDNVDALEDWFNK